MNYITYNTKPEHKPVLKLTDQGATPEKHISQVGDGKRNPMWRIVEYCIAPHTRWRL